MQLPVILETQCPECGSRPTRIEKGIQHCNGHWNEEIRFDCGCILSYSPNFKRMETDIVCPNAPKEKRKAAKRGKFIENILDIIDASKVDEEFKIKARFAMRFL